ncbi:acyl-CoA dehydrogenase [Kineosporia mesophila]|uniref:Acyl-CoA dehydrogenase n=1 Tax=Kineosporia mesophila TaxID=566012 RepID=A0ABP6ZI94_9ACTN|nr:acyl-CoA dehydrogenase family protein [Kineosporia mesophila]MCD5349737.1 acyl-CoA/acyl-ACP dehydrogenase [Kineosporia mesophila]
MNLRSDAVGEALLAGLENDLLPVAARAAEADRTAALPGENWDEIRESGYLRLFHPAALGGAGIDGVLQARAMEVLARACGGTYWSATMSTLLAGKLVTAYGDPAGKHRHLIDGVLSGERKACFAVVEPTSGSDPGTYRTRVRRSGAGYLISGTKAKITNAPDADLAVILARLDEGWCFAFVDLRQPGVSRFTTPTLGLKAMPWGGFTLDDVPVEAQDVVPVPYTEFARGMAWGWLFISVSSIATAENALAAAVRHATVHESWGRPLAHLETVGSQLADSRAEIDAVRLLAWETSWHRTQGRDVTGRVATLKITATETAVRVLNRAVQIHGAQALVSGSDLERWYRDAPMNVIGGFASNRLRELVAEQAGVGHVPYEPFDWLQGTGLELDLVATASPLVGVSR